MQGWFNALLTECSSSKYPITDVAVCFLDMNEVCGPEWTLLMRTPTGLKADTNKSSGGRDVYLCYKRSSRLFKRKDSYSARAKSTTASKPIPLSISSKDFADMDQDASALSSEPIALEESNDKDSEDGEQLLVDITFIFDEEAAPDDYDVITRTVTGSFEADLNSGSGGKTVLMCVKKESRKKLRAQHAKPITNLTLIQVTRNESKPLGYDCIDRSATGRNEADLNAGSGGQKIYLCVERCQWPLNQSSSSIEAEFEIV